jgi:putative transposase
VTCEAWRRAAAFVAEAFRVSQRRACRILGLARSSCRYYPTPRPSLQLLKRMRELAAERPRFGYRRLLVLAGRDGFRVNHKRFYRLYREEQLAVRRRKRKRLPRGPRQLLPVPALPNDRWSMDFVSDTLADGRVLRALTVVDDCTRECPAIEVDTSLPGLRVARVLDRLVEERGLPSVIVTDNGPEFTGRDLDLWVYRRGVKHHFIRPGKPVENAYIESFNGKFRDECLNEHWFLDLSDARRIIEEYRVDYNRVRPHSALDQRTPEEYAAQLARLRAPTAPSASPTDNVNNNAPGLPS